jgi:subtilisin family serine protease
VTGRSDLAGYDRVAHLTSNSGCPATEPVPVAHGPDPDRNPDDTLGQGVRVAVIDSGIPQEGEGAKEPPSRVEVSDPRWPWLEGVTGEPEADPAPVAGAMQPPSLRGHYRGHGLFVAGVVRAMAPAAEVHVFSWGTTTYGQIESELAPILDLVLRNDPPYDIISMSAGTRVQPPASVAGPPAAGRPAAASQSALSLEQFVTRLAATDTLLVCAAGNDGDQGPFQPASIVMPHTHDPRSKVAVGALKRNGQLARYSNRGTWVDVYARGSKVVNAYPDGLYEYTESPLAGMRVTFTTGFAQWSGTSFATPLVAGLVAARKSWSGQSPREAWESLSRIADTKAPFGLRTLGPGDADRGVEPPSP